MTGLGTPFRRENGRKPLKMLKQPSIRIVITKTY